MLMKTEIAVGSMVRYTRTGTTGKVSSLENIQGHEFARLESTGLLYRLDCLVPAASRIRTEEKYKADALETAKQERELGTSLREELSHMDEMCDGGG